MDKLIKRFQWATNGIVIVWNEETNFRLELLFGLGIIILGDYLKFTKLEWIIIVGCIGAVLAAEIINTAIEDLCNKIEPNTDPLIGKVKDISGGFVLVVVATSVIIGVMIFSNYL